MKRLTKPGTNRKWYKAPILRVKNDHKEYVIFNERIRNTILYGCDRKLLIINDHSVVTE